MNPFSVVVDLANTIISRIWPDRTEQDKQKFTLQLQGAIIESNLATKQLDINAAEASNPNVWVSGARPAIMWICAAAFGWTYVFQPVIMFLLTVSGHPITSLPKLDMGEMMPVLFGLLGLGGYRSIEKIKGVAR